MLFSEPKSLTKKQCIETYRGGQQRNEQRGADRKDKAPVLGEGGGMLGGKGRF